MFYGRFAGFIISFYALKHSESVYRGQIPVWLVRLVENYPIRLGYEDISLSFIPL